MILEKKTQKHKDGTSTTQYKQEVPLTEIVRLLAIKFGIIRDGQDLPPEYKVHLHKEPHGSRTYTYLVISGPNPHSGNDDSWTRTKSEVGKLLDAYVETLDNITVLWSTHVFDECEVPGSGRSIQEVLFDIVFPNGGVAAPTNNGVLCANTDNGVVCANEDQLNEIYNIAMGLNEFDIVTAMEERDEEALTEAIIDHFKRNNVDELYHQYARFVVFFINGVNDGFNPAGIEIKDTGFAVLSGTLDGMNDLVKDLAWTDPGTYTTTELDPVLLNKIDELIRNNIDLQKLQQILNDTNIPK